MTVLIIDQFSYNVADSSMINPQLQAIFERVRQSADFMPARQMTVSVVFSRRE